MKTWKAILAVATAIVCTSSNAQTTNTQITVISDVFLKKAHIKPIGDWQVDPAQTQEINQDFANALAAGNALTPGADWAAKRRDIENALRQEMESFLLAHPDSAYAPSLHLWLGRRAQQVLGYSLAMDHFGKAVDAVAGSPDQTAEYIRMEASGALAKLLAVTGRIGELNALEASLMPAGGNLLPGSEWRWARELRNFLEGHPAEGYKCGLYCLDSLGRATQPGQFLPANITETPSSTNGFTAADLLNIAVRAGVRVHAALFSDTNNLPVPSVVHLRAGHFVFLRDRRGAFYEVIDPIAFGARWLTAEDIVAEATGCVIVSDAVPPANASSLISLDATSAAAYSGRCHNPLPYDHDDQPPCPGSDAAGSDGGAKANQAPIWGGSNWAPPTAQLPPLPPVRSQGFGACPCGMPVWTVSQPYINLWVRDIPLEYQPAYGLPLIVELGHTDRHENSVVGIDSWHGGGFGGSETVFGVWSSSLFSFAELSTDGSTVDVLLPGAGWCTFNFPTNAGTSSVSYRTEMWMEQQGPGPVGSVTNLLLHYPDGSTANYGVYDKSLSNMAGVFYMTTMAGADGIQNKYLYDSNFYLTNTTAADGTAFTLHYDDSLIPDAVTSVAASYGASTTFRYIDAGGYAALTNITDAAGMSSQIKYYTPNWGDTITTLTTPYGTTQFSMFGQGGGFGPFQRTLQITNQDGTQELYAQVDSYGGGSWPDYLTSQIPTNTPVGTLDKDAYSRQGRNTFHWNAQQFASLIGLSFSSFDWTQYKQSHIQHWLANTDPTYTHWDTLSLEQAPSPDGGTTEGQITWYDYVGKPSMVDYEIGTQMLPSVIARVMPDGSTWYRYFERLTNGMPTKMVEAWMDSGSVHTRTNIYVYAANNVDLVSWTNALGIRVLTNAYNAFHQVVTNYDALGQLTTNGFDATSHKLTSTLNPAGLVTTYTYYSNKRLQQITEQPVNRTVSFTWNADGTLATYTDPRGAVETNFWDNLRRLTGTSDSRGSTTNLYYVLSGTAFPNSSGGTAILDLTATRDRLGNWTSYVYDSLRRRLLETNVNGVVTAYSYCPCGSLSTETNAWNTPVQQVTTFNFDTAGRLLYTTAADGYSVTNWYDPLGRTVAVGYGAANRWFFYNNLGLLTVRSNAYGAELTQSFDILDRPQYVTDQNGVVVTNVYDNLNRLLTRGYPDGGVERFGYSAKGLTAYTNQVNMTNFYVYDELGRKTYETNANGEILKFTNNAAGDLLSLTDGKNQITQWKYDQFGRVTNKLDQAATVVLKYIYDPNDRLTNRWSAAMGATTYTYDNFGNLKSIVYPHSPSQTYSYDSLNRLTNMVDAVGTTKYTYTLGNQVWTEIPPAAFSSSTITNTYTNRLRTSMTLQQRTGWPLWTNTFAYDAAGRLTNITSPAGSFAYSLAGSSPGSALTKKLLLPNTCYITNTFDSVARLTGTYLKNSGNTVLDSAIYGYNPAKQCTAFTNAAGTYVQYFYDPIGQLKLADSSVNTEDRGYFYDAAWNLNRLTNNGTTSTYSVDGKNQLTADPNSGTDTYDANGNLVQRTVSGVNLVYGYDDDNRLTNIIYGTSWNSQFYYDALSRLRSRTDYFWTGTNWYPNGGVQYICDGRLVIQDRNSSGVPIVSYTRGTDLSGTMQGAGGIGGLLARSSGYSSGNWTTHHFYHADGNGNITYLVDVSQAMAASYRYDPFGNTLSSSGPIAATNVYRFSSKEIHFNSGMYIYPYRFYDPNLQRWLNQDPLSELGSINLYNFVYNNAISTIDPFGLDTNSQPPFYFPPIILRPIQTPPTNSPPSTNTNAPSGTNNINNHPTSELPPSPPFCLVPQSPGLPVLPSGATNYIPPYPFLGGTIGPGTPSWLGPPGKGGPPGLSWTFPWPFGGDK